MDGKFEICGLRKENACVKQTPFCGLVPGFESRAIGLVAEIVTGQTRSKVIKNCTLRLDVYMSVHTPRC